MSRFTISFAYYDSEKSVPAMNHKNIQMKNLSKLVFCIFLLIGFKSYAQSTSKTAFEYYINFKRILTRSEVLQTEELITKKSGVLYFMADRFPVRCFILKSERLISKKEFTSWLPDKKMEVGFYGEGKESKELSYLYFINQKKAKP